MAARRRSDQRIRSRCGGGPCVVQVAGKRRAKIPTVLPRKQNLGGKHNCVIFFRVKVFKVPNETNKQKCLEGS